MSFVEFILFFLTIIIGIRMFFKWKYSYWANKNIPYIEQKILFGTFENPFRQKFHMSIHVKKYYEHFKSVNCKYGGLYSAFTPILLPVDVEIIRRILSKDFQYFTDRGFYYSKTKDPLNANLFKLNGHEWRPLRAKLTPTFTSAKLRMMFSTLVACAEPLQVYLDDVCIKKMPLDIKEVLACYTTDVIGSCAFGIDCNSFTDPDSEFRKYGKKVFEAPSAYRSFKKFISFAIPTLAKQLDFSLIEPGAERFFLRIVRETLDYRKNNNVVREDFINLLMDLKNEDGSSLSFEEIAAQAYVFFLAGFETSSTTMAFCLFELAINVHIQDKVRDEINKVLDKHNGKITYDSIMEMRYLSNVIDETLRKYPPGPLLGRVCVQDYQIPESNDIISKGTHIFVPVYALHHDPEFFPDPEKFDPERFNDHNKPNIIPFSYIPFGEGPRNCIGLRFGLMQTKVGLVVLLKYFQFLLNDKTQLPMRFHPKDAVLTAHSGIWLDIERVARNDL